MKTKLIPIALFLTLFIPWVFADNVTVHGTVGMLEAQLVNKKLESVGTVEVWNTNMAMNIIVTPGSGYLLSKINIYLDTAPAPEPVPDEVEIEYQRLDAEVEEWVVKVEECEAELEKARLECEDEPNGCDADEDYGEALEELESAREGYQEAVDERAAYVAVWPGLEEANFGEWPFGATYGEATAVPYSLTAHLSEIAGLQWGQWGEPWLQNRLVTVGVRVELKTTDVEPVTFTAWALNPNVSVDLQRVAWGDNALATRYELQHPKHGTFVGPVHGLGYATATHIGITGVDGGSPSFPVRPLTSTLEVS